MIFQNVDQASTYILGVLGSDIRLATPLGLGKPNQLLNNFYDKIKADPRRKLKIYTALSLDIPEPKNEIEKRFLGPFLQRHFGENYPSLQYVQDLKNHRVPANIEVSEFYFQAAQNLNILHAQANYVSLNYTHVAQYLFNTGIDVIFQLVAKKGDMYSLSCNSDLTLDIHDLYKKHGRPLLMVGVVHPDLPFLGQDAIVPASFFDVIVESPEVNHKLFALPKNPIEEVDHLIGLHASSLIEDDGTLQIGIGSLSDAVVHATVLRQQQNEKYQSIVREFAARREPSDIKLTLGTFKKGLYGTSEMVMDGFMHLRRTGILKRQIHEYAQDQLRYLHGAFFLGSSELYDWLGSLKDEDFSGLNMTRVSMVNDLYDAHEMAIRRQRKNARFFNTCMNVSILGGAASDTLENGQVVSGVGGQFNFVAMAKELPDSRSILMLRSAREHDGRRHSNIVWGHQHLTIPRHLRDIVVTEYGIANLAGKSDSEVIRELLGVTDAEFQDELLWTAQKNGKIAKDYKPPAHYKNNTPAALNDFFKDHKYLFPKFPFGTEFTEVEQNLLESFGPLQKVVKSPPQLLRILARGLTSKLKTRELERMGLMETHSAKDWFYQKLVNGALNWPL